jgi:Zn-dependent membrane protease YugP
MGFFDMRYLWLVALPTLIISTGVQLYLKSTFKKWSNTPNGAGENGMRIVQDLFNRTSLDAVNIERVKGSMTDHFDPHANIVRLSDPVAMQPSVASMAIAAHELGHVQQYQTGSAMIKARGFLLPALRFSPRVAYFAIFLGIFFNMTGLIWIGILFFSLMVLFSIMTLPVEIDASRRGLRLLDEAGLFVTEEDRVGSRKMLTAAGMTYLAAAVTSIMQLLYYINIAQRRR